MQRQRVDIYPFSAGRFRAQLRLPPILDERRGTNQLTYLASYVGELDCRSILIERHYIDRDYMEDHGLFYSRSLHPYRNYCQRVHFFKTTRAATERRFADVVRSAARGRDAFEEECDAFSTEAYLGFVVIKPLMGSPVGRTILRPFSESTPDGHRRLFHCVRNYLVHVNGIQLTVRGLPFQEQDVGVSACATTAIWCALQTAESEILPIATPAKITTFASRFTLPFGRVLPADEGLSVDQMCQAVQAVGVSPNLLGATDYDTTRSYLYSSLKSGMAPILIMEHESDPNSYHAVTAVGMRLIANRAAAVGIDDVSADLEAVYVHDDRTGPYLRANLVRRPADGWLKLDLLRRRDPDRIDPWLVTHILVPTHPKVRLSISSLRKLAAPLVGRVHQACELLFNSYDRSKESVSFETWVTRAHGYLSQLYFTDGVSTSSTVRELVETIIFPRYVGVIRLRSRQLGVIDVLYDTTSTMTNRHCVAVVLLRASYRRKLGGSLIAQICDAPLVY